MIVVQLSVQAVERFVRLVGDEMARVKLGATHWTAGAYGRGQLGIRFFRSLCSKFYLIFGNKYQLIRCSVTSVPMATPITLAQRQSLYRKFWRKTTELDLSGSARSNLRQLYRPQIRELLLGATENEWEAVTLKRKPLSPYM